MKKFFVNIAKVASTLPALVMGAGAFAAEVIPTIPITTPKENLQTLIQNAGTWIGGIGALLAVIVIIIGGIRYILAAGDDKKVASAKQTIISAVIGLIVIILAYSIVITINNFVNKP